jgi:hypothetical protein
MLNFLGDPTQTPHMKLAQVDQSFGVSTATGAAKSKLIRGLFKMGPFSPNWTRPSRLEENPLAWMITVNGFLIDARYAPREVQMEAYRLGLIPYLPAGREPGPELNYWQR